MENFIVWWSVISTVLGVLFLIANVAQLVAYLKEKSLIQKEKEIHKGQVKVWQHHARGIEMGLFAISSKPFESINDLKTSIVAMQQCATTLHTSLNEERLFSDTEIKERQLQKEHETTELLRNVRGNNQQT